MIPAETLHGLARELEAESISSRDLIEYCLANVKSAGSGAATILLELDVDEVRSSADQQDRLRKCGRHSSPFAGVPFSVKDLFDVQGQVTGAGTPSRKTTPVAQRTAEAVSRLVLAGMIPFGRTNMTQFAYSGLGLNPSFGTPPNRWDGLTDYAPGGSSSGAASSVVAKFAAFGLGTDTGGSCRIPAAFQGLVGFKPTASTVSRSGMLPLSPSLDSVGPIARTVGCCAAVWQLLSGVSRDLSQIHDNFSSPRLMVPTDVVMDDIEPAVAKDFERSLAALSEKGWEIREEPLPFLHDIVAINTSGGFPALESHRIYGDYIMRHLEDVDPRVASRIMRGRTLAESYGEDLETLRRSAIASFNEVFRNYDAVAYPSVAITPPRLTDLETDQAYYRTNALALRNTGFINFLDGCAISIPMHDPGRAPTGFMLSSASLDDCKLLSLAERAEAAIRRGL
tara:strand:- start:58347 stop:59705 length:1359 start_codon:yes stop_codon:yes gene_type:complete